MTALAAERRQEGKEGRKEDDDGRKRINNSSNNNPAAAFCFANHDAVQVRQFAKPLQWTGHPVAESNGARRERSLGRGGAGGGRGRMLKRPRMSGAARPPSQGSSRWAESGGRSRLPSPMVGVVAVVGVGPGLGAAIARRFARERFTVAILSRDLDKLMKLAEDIVEKENAAQVCAIRIDCSDATSVKEAFEAVNSLGSVEVLVYNTNIPFPWPPPKFTDISAESFERSLLVPCLGAFLCVQQVIKGMVQRQKGSLLFTGATASLRGGAGFSELACGKFALRALAQSLAREYQPQGIHAAHVIVDGRISGERTKDMKEDTAMNPDAIAEVYWQLHNQHRSVWTHELDLRPFSEKF